MHARPAIAAMPQTGTPAGERAGISAAVRDLPGSKSGFTRARKPTALAATAPSRTATIAWGTSVTAATLARLSPPRAIATKNAPAETRTAAIVAAKAAAAARRDPPDRIAAVNT